MKVTILLAVLFVLAAADPGDYTAKRGISTNTCDGASSLKWKSVTTSPALLRG